MKPVLRGAACAIALTLMPIDPIAFALPQKAAPSDVVSAPNWTVGSSWYYSDGYALKVTANENGNTQFDRLDAPGQWFSRQGFLRRDLVSGTATRNTVFRTVPDQAGVTLSAADPLTFQREYLSNGKLMVHASSWTVEGRETVTVPAGTFDCWIIVWRSRSLKSDWTGFERWWYSPVAQNYVRMEYKYGADEEGSRVLMRYELNPATSVHPAAAPATPAPAAPAVNSAAIIPQASPQPAAPAAVKSDLAPAEAAPAVYPIKIVAAGAGPVPQPVARNIALPELPAAPVETRPVAPVAHHVAAPAAKPIAISTTSNFDDRVWHVQIAASQQKAHIEIGFAKVLRVQAELLQNQPNGIYAIELPEHGTYYRAWVGQFADKDKARSFCRDLMAHGQSCRLIKPSDVKLAKG